MVDEELSRTITDLYQKIRELKASTDNDYDDVSVTFEKVIRDIGKLEYFYQLLSERVRKLEEK